MTKRRQSGYGGPNPVDKGVKIKIAVKSSRCPNPWHRFSEGKKRMTNHCKLQDFAGVNNLAPDPSRATIRMTPC
jgi:hypothetical protein